MDVKYVLPSILREAAEIGAHGDLLAGVRLSGAVNGERGEGCLMLYSEGLVLLYRRLGQRDYNGFFEPLDQWYFDNFCEEKYSLSLDVHCREQCVRCEFTPSERESAEQILNAVAAAHAEPQALYSEETLLMAALFIFYGNTESVAFVRELLGKQLYLAAVKYSSYKSLDSVIRQAEHAFNEQQKQSVMLNLIEMFMADDLWRSSESAAMRELARAWNIAPEIYENYAGILLLRRSLGNLFCKQ